MDSKIEQLKPLVARFNELAEKKAEHDARSKCFRKQMAEAQEPLVKFLLENDSKSFAVDQGESQIKLRKTIPKFSVTKKLVGERLLLVFTDWHAKGLLHISPSAESIAAAEEASMLANDSDTEMTTEPPTALQIELETLAQQTAEYIYSDLQRPDVEPSYTLFKQFSAAKRKQREESIAMEQFLAENPDDAPPPSQRLRLDAAVGVDEPAPDWDSIGKETDQLG